MEPNRVEEGSGPIHVVLDGSGFTTTSLVRVNGISVKMTFRRHIIDCAKSLGSLKRLIHRFRDPLHVGLNRVGERSHDNERLALKKHAYDALVARLPYRRRTRNLIL